MDGEKVSSNRSRVKEGARGGHTKNIGDSSALQNDDLIKRLKCSNATLTRSCLKARKKIHELQNELLEAKRTRGDIQHCAPTDDAKCEMERLRIDLKRLEKENAHLNDLLRQRKETCHAECNKRHKEALCRFACSVLEKLKAISYVESLVTHSLDALCNAYQQVDGPLSQISSFCDVIEEISSMQGPSSSSQSISSELLSGSGSTRKVTTDIGCNRPEKKRSTAVQPTAVASTMHVGNKVDTVNTNAVSKLKQPPSGVEKCAPHIKESVISDKGRTKLRTCTESIYKGSVPLIDQTQIEPTGHDVYSFVSEFSECNAVVEQPKRSKRKRLKELDGNPAPKTVTHHRRSTAYGLRPQKRVSYVFS